MKHTVTSASAIVATAALLCLTVSLQIESATCQEETTTTTTTTRTALEFSRAFDTCDGDDRSFEGTTRVIYAWNDDDPTTTGDMPVQHPSDQRGAESVNLLGANPDFEVPETDIEQFDMTVREHTIAAGSYSTLYWCEIFKIPNDRPLHVVRFNMLIDPENFINVHHAVVYECPAAEGLEGTADVCPSSGGTSFPEEVSRCEGGNVVWAWAVGGSNNTLPSNVGFPVGQNGVSYMMLEMHYDIPDMREITDASGVVLDMTPSLREIEAGTLTIGAFSDAIHIRIPPGETDFEVETWCPGSCLADDIAATEQGELTLFAGLLHAHLAGRRIKASHYRDGAELAPLLQDDFYDFNFQQYVFYDTPVTVLPGDDLGLTCNYDTTDRDEDTLGGIDTEREMCLAYFMYYPRLPASLCWGAESTDDGTPLLQCNEEFIAPFVVPNITTEYVEADNCLDHVPTPSGSTPIEATSIDVEDIDAWRASFENVVTLRGGAYELYWTTDASNETVRFGVDVATEGWLGFGFSANGNMLGADMIMAWVTDEGEIHFADRHSNAFALPVVDDSQDYFGVRGVKYTVDADVGIVTPTEPGETSSPDGVASASSRAAPTSVLAVLAASLVTVAFSSSHSS